MLKSIWEDLKREFNFGNMISRLMIINVSVFVVLNLVKIILYASNGGQIPAVYDDILYFFCMSSDWRHILTHPWVIITYAFVHESFWHILWNMLFLYWFGRIVGDFIGNHRVLPIYFLGAITGAVMFYLSANLLQYGGDFMLGASGSVMAFVVAAGVLSPDYIMRLILIGDVKLKYIVAVLVLLDLISIANNSNTGGHFAHIGGALFGWVFVASLRNGTDLARPMNSFARWVNNLFRRKQKSGMPAHRSPLVVIKHRNESRKSHAAEQSPLDDDYQLKLDAILEKIKEKGYESLSEVEKDFLFRASKK